jgi:hypothetical protein
MKNRSHRLRHLTLALVVSGGLAPLQAQAQTPEIWQSPQPVRPTTALPAPVPRADRFQIAAGGGGLFIRSSGLDPFSREDAVGRFSLSLSGVVWSQERLRLAVGLGLDAGTTSASARGASSDLGLTLFSASAEARYTFASRFYAFGRLAPGLQHASARLRESSAPQSAALTDTFTTAALSTSAGVAFNVNGPLAAAGVWFVFDGGYLLAPSRELALRPDLDGNGADQLGTLDLGSIAARGAFFRVSLALSY